MEVIFKVVRHSINEIEMGQVYWADPVDDLTAISATANWNGFAPLKALASKFDWNCSLLEKAVNECNKKNQIAIVNQLKPLLFLVPQTRGQGQGNFLINDLLDALEITKTKIINFTHYGFIQSKLPADECIEVLMAIMNRNQNKTCIEKFIIDLDSRIESEFKQLYSNTKINKAL